MSALPWILLWLACGMGAYQYWSRMYPPSVLGRYAWVPCVLMMLLLGPLAWPVGQFSHWLAHFDASEPGRAAPVVTPQAPGEKK